MSESSENKNEKKDEVAKILSKVNMMTKMMKTIHDDVDEIKQKMVTKPENEEKEKEKEKVEKAFEAKGIGRPAGNFETKQKQYLDMLNSGKIKQPKDKTLEFYKIAKDKEGKYYLWPDEKWKNTAPATDPNPPNRHGVALRIGHSPIVTNNIVGIRHPA